MRTKSRNSLDSHLYEKFSRAICLCQQSNELIHLNFQSAQLADEHPNLATHVRAILALAEAIRDIAAEIYAYSYPAKETSGFSPDSPKK